MVAKITISLKRIWEDPGRWWKQAHWFSKLMLVMVFSSMAGAMSIAVYSGSMYSAQKLLLKLQSEKIDELAVLKSELGELKNEKKSGDEDVLEELADLRKELLEYQAQQQGRDQILGLASLNTTVDKAISVLGGELDEDLPTGTREEKVTMLEIKTDWTEVDVFAEAKASSRVIGEVGGGKIYFYDLKKSGWYRIDLDDEAKQQGWVQAQFIEELN